jgi:predicted transcriptional regulator of viral defense system
MKGNYIHKGGKMRYLRTLGPVSARLISSLYELGRIIFTVKDIEEITGLKGGTAKKLRHDLIKRKIIARLKPGKYIIIPQEIGDETSYIGNWYVVGREIVKSHNYYISHYSAMDIHNMLTHPVTKVYITTPVQEYKKQRIVGNATFEFIYTDTKNIWGIQQIWVTKSEQARVSDIERTIIDCLYRPKYCGGILEIVRGIWIQKEKIDFEKLHDYIKKFNRIVVIKRLGYILEGLNLQKIDYLNKLRIGMNDKYYLLDPLLSTETTYKNSWKLIANISPEEMRKSVST